MFSPLNISREKAFRSRGSVNSQTDNYQCDVAVKVKLTFVDPEHYAFKNNV